MIYTIKYLKDNNREVDVYYSFEDLLDGLKQLSKKENVDMNSVEIITT